MSRSRRFLSGAAFSYLYQACVAVVGIWLTPFYLRVLGAHDYGIWLVGLQVLGILLLCDLGVIAVLPRDVAHANGRELSGSDPDELPMLIASTAKIVLPQTILVALVALALFFFRPSAASGLRGPVALVLLTFVVTYPFRMFPAVLQGLQEIKFLGQLRICLWAVSAGITVLLLFLGARFYALAWGWCFLESGSNVGALVRLYVIRPDLLRARTWNTVGAFQWRWLTRGLWVSIGQITNTFTSGLDLLIIAPVLGPATVVVYSCTGKLVQVLQNQPQSLASYALPGLSQMKAAESRERIRTAATCLTQAMVLVGGAIFCVVLPLNQQFVHLWTGSRYFGGLTLTILFLVNFVARLIDYTLAMALFAFGYEKPYAVRSMLDGVVSATLAIILVGPLGLQGVLLGFTCGALLVAIPIDLYLFAREFEVSVLECVRPYFPYLWRFTIVGCVALPIVALIEIPNLFVLVITASAIGLIYLLLAFPYVRRSELGGYIRAAVAGYRTAMRARFIKVSEPTLSSSGDR
jgi:O-antigen/teichoic acid export membrane protein